jgi:sugar phosphate isomerase/epimerase
MHLSRRAFLAAAAAAGTSLSWLSSAANAAPALFKVGVTDWNLDLEGKPEAVMLAKQIGFDGVQISLSAGEGMPWVGNDVLDRFAAESKRVSLPISSVCLNVLHKNYLKSDPEGRTRVVEAIPMAKRVGVEVILLPFFGKGALNTTGEMDHVADVLKEVAPEAEKAGIVLGLENTISAKDNVRILDRVQSPAVKVYYDVGNSTKGGFKVIDEIRWLGRDRICEVHLKDNPHYLGEGTIDFPGVVSALRDIGFAKWAELETDAPSKDIPADMRRNLGFIRHLMSQS